MTSNDTALAVILGVAGAGLAILMVVASKRAAATPGDPYLQHEAEQAAAQARKAASSVTDFGGRA